MFYRKLLFLAVSALAFASVEAKSPRILKIGDESVTKQEFEYYYNKNADIAKDRPSPSEYVDLFVNFRLKVQQARDLQYDTASAYVQEIEGYRKQLAEPYLTDDSLKNALIAEEYARLQEDVRVSHILLRTMGPDTAEAYAKGQEILQRLKEGDDFEILAREYSQDRGSAARGGELGYITGLTLMYPVESAAYNTPVGEVSGLVRTAYGYHIVKPTDRRPSRGEIHVAHILIMKPETPDSAAMQAKRAKVESVYKAIKEGADFAEMSKSYSEDGANASAGGELPWLTVGRTNMYFDDVAFALQSPGDVSEILEVPYGWHIVKLLEVRSLPSLESMKGSIESFVMRDERRKMISDSYIAKLKDKYNFKEGKGNVIAKFDGNTLTKEGLEEFCKQNPKVRDSVRAYVNSSLIAYADSRLEEDYPDFGMLMQEYRDGILLFNISNDSVWQKSSADTAGLAAYFNAHAADYAWEKPRFKGRIVYCKTAEVRERAEELAKTLPADSVVTVLRRTFNTDGEKNLEFLRPKTYIQGNDPVADYCAFKVAKKPVIKDYEDAFAIGELIEQPRSYEDVRGAVINNYQQELESRWLESLRSKYPVKVYYNVLKTVE